MFSMWMGIALLLVVAAIFICLPLIMSLRGSELKRNQSNVEIYKSQLADLEADLRHERIGQAEYESLSQEIKLNLLADTEETEVRTNQQGKWVYVPAVIVTLVMSVGLYHKLGSENELAITQALENSGNPDFSREDALALIDRIDHQTKVTPEDIEMWYLYGRLNFDMGQFDQAVVGFTQALQLLPVDAKQDLAVAMSQLAQAQFFANGRKLTPATQSLLQDVLGINPNDETALGLLGVASFDSGQYVEAVTYWQRLINIMPVNNPNVAAIQGGIDTAMGRMSAEERATIEKAKAAVQPAVIEITVDISNDVQGKVPQNADLFVLAKAKNGPPMPLAVQRISVTQWPVTVILDDSMAMMPALRLSQYDDVVITARISKSGVGNAKAGDLQGMSQVISSSSKAATVTINQEI